MADPAAVNRYKTELVSRIFTQLGVAVLCLVCAGKALCQSSVLSFDKLLEESGLRYAPSPLFASVPDSSNMCDFKLKHEQSDVRVCFLIRPLDRMEIDYSDPHSSAPDPNQVYPLLFESLTNQLSNHEFSPSREYTPDQADDLFGADWAAATALTLNKSLPIKHEQGFLVAIHKAHKADAYLLFQYNDPEIAKSAIKDGLSLLQFKKEVRTD